MDATGGYVKKIGRVSGRFMQWLMSNYCFRWLGLCRMGFQVVLNVRPSSLLMWVRFKFNIYAD